MKMRHLLIPIVALALSASAAVAQQAPPPGGAPAGGAPAGGQNRGARRMQMLLQGITLTAAQQASVDSINTVFMGKMPPFVQGQQPDSASMAQRRTLTTERDAAIRGLLTAEQQRLWDTNMQTMQANMPPRP